MAPDDQWARGGPRAHRRCAAAAWLATLDETLREEATFAFDGPERTDWQFVPMERRGVSMKEMRLPQRRAARALLESALSDRGYLKVTTIRSLSKEGAPDEAEFLVDTGSIDCLAPRSALSAAGIEAESTRTYELANGELVEYEVGFARLSLLGQETVVQILLGPDKAEPILGVLALESLGIVVDPVSQWLKRLHALPLK